VNPLSDKDMKKHRERVAHLTKGQEPFRTAYQRELDKTVYKALRETMKKEKKMRKQGDQ